MSKPDQGPSRVESLRAGLGGAAAMTLVAFFLRTTGLNPMNLELLLGSAVTGSFGPGAWVLGLALHLALGAGFGLIYGRFMRHIGSKGWKVGAPLALVHVLLAGLLLPMAGSMHPLVNQGLLIKPRMFGVDLGWTGPLTFLLLHEVYGVTLGVLSVVWHTERKAEPARAVAEPPLAVGNRS